jgi:hypothetical protein
MRPRTRNKSGISAQPYSHWGSFIARPDATIPRQLEINKPGMLIHDFPDGLSEGGWSYNPLFEELLASLALALTASVLPLSFWHRTPQNERCL